MEAEKVPQIHDVQAEDIGLPKSEGLMEAAIIKPQPKAGEDMNRPSSSSERELQGQSPPPFVFTLFEPSTDWVMPSHFGEGHLPHRLFWCIWPRCGPLRFTDSHRPVCPADCLASLTWWVWRFLPGTVWTKPLDLLLDNGSLLSAAYLKPAFPFLDFFIH